MTRKFSRQSLGNYGEYLARKFLVSSGYSMIDNNWRCNQGEVDLVAWDVCKRIYVFCEVKTRKNLDYGHPFEAISARKLGTMFAVANAWKKEHLSGHEHHRIDALSVYWPLSFPKAAHARVEHLKEIFVCH